MKWKKLCRIFLLAAALVMLMAAVPAFAADESVVYVKGGGSGD